MKSTIQQQGKQLAKEFIAFNTNCHSPYHAVNEVEKILKANQFTRLLENKPFEIEAGGRYYIKRGYDSSMIVFNVPKKVELNNLYLKMIATHVDSPCLRVAPKSIKQFKSMEQCCIQTYGGGLWHTWFDRDLFLGGRVVVLEEGKLVQKIFTSPYPIANVPNLAIHLTKDRSKFSPDKETELRPIIAQKLEEILSAKLEVESSEKNKELSHMSKAEGKHSTVLLNMIATELKCAVGDIVDFDLCFADANPPNTIGINQEFISSPRLDNLFSVYFSLMGYLDDLNSSNGESNHLNMLMMFDHEEIGSNTYVGADSSYVQTLLTRIINKLQKPESMDHTLIHQILARSYLVSADMAHGVHPNYASIHQCNHQVEINKGVVLKVNCNGRYITDSVSSSIMKYICGKANIPVQDFIVSQSSPCGSTVGPMLSSKLGTIGIDVGMPQFAMHSIRETCGVLDTYYYKEFFKAICSTSMNDINVGQEN